MDPKQLRISDYSYVLPEDRIAQFAIEQRDAAKLLVNGQGKTSHRQVAQMASALEDLGFRSGGHLVLNETRVVQARLFFPRGEAHPFELFYLSPEAGSVEQAMEATRELIARCKVRFSKKWKAGQVLQMDSLSAERIHIEGDVSVVRFFWDGPKTWSEILAHLGELPLPPYMRRKAEEHDQHRYQTVFARVEGSVAAPTAGLHWTPALLTDMDALGWKTQSVRLHVGAGTFQPVVVDAMEGHPMHAEEIHITRETLQSLADGRPIWAVGTTAARTLESVYWLGCISASGMPLPKVLDQWTPYDLDVPKMSRSEALRALGTYLDETGQSSLTSHTALLIAPPYSFRVVDLLMTNFHQPQSTLLLLIAAGIGSPWKDLYTQALAQEYRFLSYGDACLFRLSNGP